MRKLLSIGEKPEAGGGIGSGHEEQLLEMLDNSKDVIYHFQIKPEWKFLYLSPAIDLWLGEGTAAAAMSDPAVPFRLVHPDDLTEMMDKVSNQVDYGDLLIQRWKDQDGIYHWFEERMTPVYEDGELVALQGVTRNIDARMEQQRRLEYQANYDALTDVHNRMYFNSVMEELDEGKSTSAGLILCDVDELKSVNDRFGHEAGDELLKRVARYLTRFSGADTTLARIGGDEFVILVTGEEAEGRLRELVGMLAVELTRYNAAHPDEEIHLSVGSAFMEDSAGCMAELFRRADEEMYRNKKERRRRQDGGPLYTPL